MGDYLYMLTLTVVGVGLFAFLDKARGAVIIASCLCGALTFTVSEIVTPFLGGSFWAYLISAGVNCVFSEFGARLMKLPVTVIMLPAIIPLVPGSLLYRAVRTWLTGGDDWYSSYGAEAIAASLGIAVAISAVSAVFRLLQRFFNASE